MSGMSCECHVMSGMSYGVCHIWISFDPLHCTRKFIAVGAKWLGMMESADLSLKRKRNKMWCVGMCEVWCVICVCVCMVCAYVWCVCMVRCGVCARVMCVCMYGMCTCGVCMCVVCVCGVCTCVV